MKWKSVLYCFIIKPDRDVMQSNKFDIVNIPPNMENVDKWGKMLEANNRSVDLFKPSRFGTGLDERPINETDNMYNITMNFFKMKMLRRLESKHISVEEKLNIINENDWVFNSQHSKYYVNLLAGDLLDSW
uniref:Uncharacterized protein n=1 Tax=viral metagenome TaxID=1070528 RepID=A0A6C0DPB7_9ZZZZ